MCGCVPQATQEEASRMERWYAGEEVEGFPPQNRKRAALASYESEKYKAPPVNKDELRRALDS